MSIARGFGLNGKSYYMNITAPREILCNFVVDSANGNGLGIRSLKSNGYIENVYMHTSASPLLGNPNPAVGYIVVKFKNNFNYYLGGFDGEIVPLASTSTTSVTSGNPYAITSLGTTTLAQWVAKGFPAGFVPAVGSAFIANATGAIGGTGTVGVPGIPSIVKLAVVGDPNQMIANASISQNAGAQIVIGAYAATNSSTTTLVASAPADGTVIAMSFMFDASTVTIDGI